MKNRQHARDTEAVIRQVMKTVTEYDKIGKTEFETILHQIMEQVQKNTGMEPESIAQVTTRVIDDLPKEYGALSERQRSWEALIAYLYTKYLRELGVFNE